MEDRSTSNERAFKTMFAVELHESHGKCMYLDTKKIVFRMTIII